VSYRYIINRNIYIGVNVFSFRTWNWILFSIYMLTPAYRASSCMGIRMMTYTGEKICSYLMSVSLLYQEVVLYVTIPRPILSFAHNASRNGLVHICTAPSYKILSCRLLMTSRNTRVTRYFEIECARPSFIS